MKKFILLISIFIITNSYCYSATANQSTLGKIENALYGFQYNDESNLSRLDRLEKSVYGQVSKKSEAERIAKLSKDISADSIGKEIEPVEDTFAEHPEYLAEDLQETSDVSYPVVDALEEQIFKQVNKKDNIKTRLTKLEEKVFHKTYSDDLSSRVDRLRAEIKPPALAENPVEDGSSFFYDEDTYNSYNSYPQSNNLKKIMPNNGFDYDIYKDADSMFAQSYNQQPYYQNYTPKTRKTSLSTIEKKLFRKSYTNDSMEKRLSRIETAMFGSEFSQDDTQTRLDRVSSAFQAEKSAGKYDSNKFSQNLATAMQIGTLILMVLACIL